MGQHCKTFATSILVKCHYCHKSQTSDPRCNSASLTFDTSAQPRIGEEMNAQPMVGSMAGGMSSSLKGFYVNGLKAQPMHRPKRKLCTQYCWLLVAQLLMKSNQAIDAWQSNTIPTTVKSRTRT